jgi:hypothetical protein
MSGRGSVRWAPRMAGSELESLPLRLRGPTGAIFAEGMTGGEMSAPPGLYYLAVTMPNGAELIGATPVKLVAGKTARPKLADLERAILAAQDRAPAGAAADASAEAEPGAAGDSAFPDIRPGNAAQDEAGPPAGATEVLEACRWCGRWLHLWSDAEESAAVPDPLGDDYSRAADFTVGRQERIVERTQGCDDVLLVRHPGGRKAFILPGDRDISGEGPLRMGVSIYRGGDRPQLHYESPLGPEVNDFIRYVIRGALGQARRISLDLLGANSSPAGQMHGSLLRAVVAGYVLLRANELSQADWLTERLVLYAPEVPDLHIIRMEGLARLGGTENHDKAVAALRDALAAGCPWFRSGVSYALERLRLYVAADADHSIDFHLGDAAELEGWKRRFNRMVRKLDTTELYTTFDLDPVSAAPAPPPAPARSR